MKEISRILLAFRQTAEALKPPSGEEEERSGLSGINTCAYYLIVFAQFESIVTNLAEHAIAEGRRSDDFRARRVWQVLHDRNRQRIEAMPFLDRLALVLDKGSHLFRDVELLYKQRNAIAHGSMLGERLDVVALATRLNSIADRITQDAP